MHTHTQT